MTPTEPEDGHTTGRARSPRGEGDRLRDDLLDAAVDLIADTGQVDSVSLRAVARRTGVSPTAVYRHFEDHDHLVRAALERLWDRFATGLANGVAGRSDPYERLRGAGDAYVAFAMAEPGVYRVLFSEGAHLDGERATSPGSAYAMLVELVADVLRDRGDDRDPQFVAALVHTWIHGIVDLCGNRHGVEWPDTPTMLDQLGERLGLTPTEGLRDPGAAPPDALG